MVGEQVYTASSLGELPAVAKAILEALEEEWVVCFWGGMGVGKTTLIAEICRQLGVVGEVASPTFALINVYNCRRGREIYHFDFYRIEAVQDAWNILGRIWDCAWWSGQGWWSLYCPRGV